MATVRVSVTDCAQCVRSVLEELEDRPSCPVVLFLNGQRLAQDFAPVTGTTLRLSAVRSQAITERKRAGLIRRVKAERIPWSDCPLNPYERPY